MDHYFENGVLTIYINGRVDSNNAPVLEREIMDVTAEHPGADLVLDGEKLEYISSAGLRVLMKLSKALWVCL